MAELCVTIMAPREQAIRYISENISNNESIYCYPHSINNKHSTNYHNVIEHWFSIKGPIRNIVHPKTK